VIYNCNIRKKIDNRGEKRKGGEKRFAEIRLFISLKKRF